MVFFQGYGFAEAYIKGHIDIEGDLRALVRLRDELRTKYPPRWWMPRWNLNTLRNYIHEFIFSNTHITQAKKNAEFHYGRGTEMFRHYLDETMTYTCAYWKEGTKNIHEAQKNKIAHTLKKLNLKKGGTLVDIGGGWGSLLLEAHEQYGTIGTNVSPVKDQNDALRKEIEKRGLAGKIHIKEVDFREDEEEYDAYLSLGVYEHAGYHQLEAWIAAMSRNLKEGGTGILHFIGNIKRDIEGTGIFVRKFVFPGGYLPGLAETLEIMDKHGLEILDVENLRRHYGKTLDAWAERFDENWEKIRAIDPKKYNEAFRRQWRFYLYTCAEVFRQKHSSIGLFQIVFSKGRTNTYPMSREFLYKPTEQLSSR